MNYQECLDYLSSLVPTLARPTMERMQNYLRLLHDPQNKISCVHVGGTNGKGSVTTMVASMLTALGYRTGKFTGPHLERFNERFVIDGKIIDDQTFARVATAVQERSHNLIEQFEDSVRLTWFEFLMAMAVEYFNQESLTAAVYEVGLGGRFDATNVLMNVGVSVITNVELDHVHLLGDTRAKIAGEKSGIIKPGVPVVTGCTGEALDVVRSTSLAQKSPLVVIINPDEHFRDVFTRYELQISGDLDSLSRQNLSHLRQWLLQNSARLDDLGLKGAYQRGNALTALVALAVYLGNSKARHIDTGDFEIALAALSQAQWPGRFELLDERPIIVDGAHNAAGARALRQSLEQLYPDKNFVFVFACFENKDYQTMLSQLLRKQDALYAPLLTHKRPTRFALEICQYAQSLGAQSESCPDYKSACELAVNMMRSAPERFAPRFVVTGSFALVKESLSLEG